jgi:hypothetical protein
MKMSMKPMLLNRGGQKCGNDMSFFGQERSIVLPVWKYVFLNIFRINEVITDNILVQQMMFPMVSDKFSSVCGKF